ncbi:hypothetical protein D7243_20555 [Stutzerimonas stutzeri]|nr:hypothetical protein [Stutzerimonas stutzeri]
MKSDENCWPELATVFENLLCPPLSKPLSRHGSLRNSLNTLANALCPSEKDVQSGGRRTRRDKARLISLHWRQCNYHEDSRSTVHIDPRDTTLLWNAILLQGVYGEPKAVIAMLTEEDKRLEYAEWASALFLDRQSVAGLGLLREELFAFLKRLPLADLRSERLPNPFADVLPQMGLGPQGSNLLKILATQTAALSLGDGMMKHYLNGNLEHAYEAACALVTENPLLLKYRHRIQIEYQAASEFDTLLDSLR